MNAYHLVRPLLFRLDPEQVHQLTLALLRQTERVPLLGGVMHRYYTVNDPRLKVRVFGLDFANPVGLAAGYDKDAVAVRALSNLGFGHIEVGTVTLRAQAGNPRPRVHRVPQVQGLVNRMGFPNAGVDALHVRRGTARVGINIGKNKDTSLEGAALEYGALFKRVHAQADYVTINVSSPNTPGLRQLQTRARVEELVRHVTGVRDSLTPHVPLLIKIAPDMSDAELDELLDVTLAHGIDGIIATNTTLGREGLPPYAQRLEGGLSGAPLRARATAVIRRIVRVTNGRLPIIGVGGIASAADALEKLQAGAQLVQVYTGLVYQGPGLVRQINRGLLAACEARGVGSVGELAAMPV